MIKYFLDKRPWKFVLFITASGVMFSMVLAGIATWIVYHKLTWFVEIVAFIIPVLASPAVMLISINFSKSYQVEKENHRNILEVIRNIDDIFFISDKEGKLIFVNEAMTRALGFSEDELLGESLLGIHPEKEHEKIVESIGILLKQKYYSCRTYLKRKDNTTIPVETYAKMLLWNDRLISVCISRDISEQLKMINKLRDNEVRFREFAEMLPELVCETDEDGKVTFANKNAANTFGYSKKDLEKGINILDLIIPEEREKARENMQKGINKEISPLHEYTAIKKDRTTFLCLVSLAPIFGNSKIKGFRGLIIDITERKNKEDRLIKTLNFVENLIENIPLGLLIFDSNETCVSHNKIALDILDIEEKKPLAKNF